MTVKEWLLHTFEENEFPRPRPRAKCKDRFSISIQANEYVYCLPRETLASGEYSALELGYASKHEELLEEYREGAIYPYVPMEVVEKVIEKHGGIVGYGEVIKVDQWEEGAIWKN